MLHLEAKLCERIVFSVEDWENYNQALVHECAVVSVGDRKNCVR